MKARSERSRLAVRRGHDRLTTVTLHNLADGVVGTVPVYDGSVVFDLTSSRGTRSGLLRVPGYDWWPLFNPSAVTWVTVTQEIEGESWDLGEFPVSSVDLESPGGLVTVGLGDWSARRSRSKAEAQTDLTFGTTVAQLFQHHVSHVMPNGDFTVVQDDTDGALKPSSPRVSANGDVWVAIRELANDVGAVALVTSLTTGELRVFDPYQPYHEDLTDTLNRVVTGWDMDPENVVNRVVVRVNSDDKDGGTFVGRKSISGGTPWDFDRDGVGYCILVESESVPKATQAIANAKAQYLYDRRAGAVKAVSLRVVPQPWLEPGDVVAWQDGRGGGDQGSIDFIEYPLRADGAMNIRLRGIPVIGI